MHFFVQQTFWIKRARALSLGYEPGHMRREDSVSNAPAINVR
jgi:hypothetical protein